jgi:hypothetical protein
MKPFITLFLFLSLLFCRETLAQKSLDSLRMIIPENKSIKYFGLSESYKYVWATFSDNSVSVIDLKSKKIIRTFNNPELGICTNVEFISCDNYVVLVYSWAGVIEVFSLSSGERIKEYELGYRNSFLFSSKTSNLIAFSNSHFLDNKQNIVIADIDKKIDSLSFNLTDHLYFGGGDNLYYFDSTSFIIKNLISRNTLTINDFKINGELIFGSLDYKCLLTFEKESYFFTNYQNNYIRKLPENIEFHSVINDSLLCFFLSKNDGNIDLYLLNVKNNGDVEQIGELTSNEFEVLFNKNQINVYFLHKDQILVKNLSTKKISELVLFEEGSIKNEYQFLNKVFNEFKNSSLLERTSTSFCSAKLRITIDSLDMSIADTSFMLRYSDENQLLVFDLNFPFLIVVGEACIKFSKDSIFLFANNSKYSFSKKINSKNSAKNDSLDLSLFKMLNIQIVIDDSSFVLLFTTHSGECYAICQNKERIDIWRNFYYSQYDIILAKGRSELVMSSSSSIVKVDFQTKYICKLFAPEEFGTFYYHNYIVLPIKNFSEFLILCINASAPYSIRYSHLYQYSEKHGLNKCNISFSEKNIENITYIDSLGLIVYSLENRVFSIFSIKHNCIFLQIHLLSSDNYLVKLPDSPYYMCSKDASKMLHYVTPNLKVIGFEQLDPVYNRPDIVLDSIGKYFGNSDGGMIDEYRKSWEKRIDRLGLDKEKLGKGEIAVPNAEIVGADAIAYENKNGKLDIKVAANDPKYPLRRFNVYVNEVPLYGSAGISIAHLKKQVWDTTVSVPLSMGENKIQVSVMNELGLENFKYPSYVNYTPSEPIVAKTYYIGIGVNEFKESTHNLKYCVKDVTDLSTSFSGPNTEVKLFTNAQVTKENILALKDYLAKTTFNDKVIISCSSHGLLDDSLNFYLAMHDVDFNNPKARGLKYEELENLLDGIPARQKLLLLDACNSGENDKTEVFKNELANNHNNMDSTQILAARGVIIKLEDENKSNFKKMNELFVNVRNNTGSVIISAAGGQESALEAITVDGKSIENGAFSYCVLEYLKNNSNKPEELTVNKLKNYVEKRVEEITNGKQQPTSRQETMEVDWRLR